MKYILYIICIVTLLGACSKEKQVKYKMNDIENGVSKELAEERSSLFTDLSYELKFDIPREKNAPIFAEAHITGKMTDTKPIVLDFRESADKVKEVLCDNRKVDFKCIKGHIIIPAPNTDNVDIQIEFIAGESSLNRHDDYLYTLFVPDRASTAFPCFDQPDLKATYKLSLKIPAEWKTIAGGKVLKRTKESDGYETYDFDETKPMSTYLFSFVAGKFSELSETRDGRTITMLHKETDADKIKRNAKEIFDLHFNSLKWMEEYTGITFPFKKMDIAAIPAFQYGGMEHVGAIPYRASLLMLDENPTQIRLLRRATLIAHEVTHTWFGNLVTMKWFDDVWLKEVFANFMAAKIVHPSFPDVDHDLRFLMSHHPSAYADDRTEGTHPIQQPLDNLLNAGTLYGDIIYKKAPIVMRQLELIIGKESLKKGLREYLKVYGFHNATWDDLIEILAKYSSDIDLEAWSKAWVKGKGMPSIKVVVDKDSVTGNNSLCFLQEKQTEEGQFWQQVVKPTVITGNQTTNFNILLLKEKNFVVSTNKHNDYDCIIPDGSGYGYGYFDLDAKSRNYMLSHFHKLPTELNKGTSLLMLWEEMLNAMITPVQMADMLMRNIPKEKSVLLKYRMLSYLRTIYWKFFTEKEKFQFGEHIETMLWLSLQKTDKPAEKIIFFRTYYNMVNTEKGLDKLIMIWQKKLTINGLTISEDDFTAIACQIAVRDSKFAENILQKQFMSLTTPYKKDRLKFLTPALSSSQLTRDEFFRSLEKIENRAHEPWVVEALYYLHHPLRAKSSEKYILKSLDMMEELQRTGDIFFPTDWVMATLSGHSSASAVQVVDEFLESHPDYPLALKNKILQASDMLYRASDIKKLSE